MAYIESTGAKVASSHGFNEIRTPVFEFSELFERSLGDSSDVVSKEMYSFLDKSSHSVTLRPENTAGVSRALLSVTREKNSSIKERVFYHGPMFRYERPQRGRQRQFNQFGVEMLGFDGPSADVECIEMASRFLKSLGLGNSVKLLINSLGYPDCRFNYMKALDAHFGKYQLSSDSHNRLAQGRSLRILDSKHPDDSIAIQEAPGPSLHRSKDASDRFEKVLNGLDMLDIGYEIDPTLVRGLDYYTHTTFEFVVTDDITSKAQRPSAVLAGGRYDDLSKTLGYNDSLSCIGWASGMERLMLERARIGLSIHDEAPKVFVLPLFDAICDQDVIIHQVFRVASLLRDNGVSAIPWNKQLDCEAPIAIKKGFKEAERLGCTFVAIIGDEETTKGHDVAMIKKLSNGTQVSAKGIDDILDILKRI